MNGLLFDPEPAGLLGHPATGFFCWPDCAQGGPTGESFTTQGQALLAGYRPCPTCQPLRSFEATDGPIAALLADLLSGQPTPIDAPDLWARGLEPAFVQRWFLGHYGLGLAAFRRALRSVLSFSPTTVPTSLPKRLFRSPPPGQTKAHHLHLAQFATPIGPLLAAATADGICLLEFHDRVDAPKLLRRLRREFEADLQPGTTPLLDALGQQLAEYFGGRRRHFELPLVFPGSPFQVRVWNSLLAIPYGHTLSYSQQADQLDAPRAIRAIASANGRNRLSILIPCHRVVGSDGSLTGYGGGLWRKRWLLRLEAGKTEGSALN